MQSMISKWAPVAALVAGSAAALAGSTAPWRQFDAALDPAGDDIWANTGTAQTGQAQNFRFSTAQTASSVSNPLVPGITKAYEIGTTGPAIGADWSFLGQAGGGRANFADNSFEVFFRVDNLSGSHLIMEIGGTAAGLSLGLDGNTLIWATNPGGAGADDTHSVSTTLGTGWHHAVGVWSRTTLLTSLYLDGSFVGDVALSAATTGWTGSNEATLGGINTSAATTMDLLSLTDFDGAIAAFNYYNQALSADEIRSNFDAVFVPAPGSAALLAAGLLVARRRR
jgi:hypothetical protein